MPPRPPFVHLDPRAAENLQTQIYRAIRSAILDGRLPPGARLLSSRALAEDLGVSRTTTLLAYDQLTAEGYLTARHGSGTFVGLDRPDDLPRVHPHRPATPVPHPPLSRRGAALAGVPSPAWRLAGPACAFRIGVPALDDFPHRLWARLVNRRLRTTTTAERDYGDATGQLPLREAIAAHVSSARGTSCSADQVIVVAGAQQGLALVAHMLLDPGDRAAIEDPGYPGARSALVGAGAVLRAVPVDRDGLDIAALRRMAGGAKLAYVTPSHQFPCGVTMTLQRRLALLHWARAARAWIVEDDYDSEFRYGDRPVPCLHGLDVDGRVIYVGSFSKSLFPALRLGFLIVPSDLRPALMTMRMAADVHPPVFDQLVVADLIGEGHYDRHLRRMRGLYRERLEALDDACRRRCAGALRLHPVRAGLHTIAELAPDVDEDRVAAEAAARGIELMPLSSYHTGAGEPQRGLVLGFGAVGVEAIQTGVERLALALEAAWRPARGRRTRDATRAAGSPTPSM